MSLAFFLRSLVTLPGVFLWPALLGFLLLFSRRAGLGRWLLGVALGGLYLFSTGLVAGWMAVGLERLPALQKTQLESLQGYDAIVVLGGGRDEAAAEFGGFDMPNRWTAARLRYGAWLYRQTGLPILVSGGRLHDEAEAEADIMADSLIRDHVANVRWRETASRTTLENARLSAAMLRPEGVNHILLVTTAAHMPRSVLAFEAAGFTVLPAPTGFAGFSRWPLAMRLLPSAQALEYNRLAMHEYLGGLWYRLRLALAGVSA